MGITPNDDALIEWIGRCLLPWEGSVRAWLRRASVKPAEIDDIIQESYSRIAGVENFRTIANPRAYFLKVARNILFEQLRRARIVRIDTIAEMDLPDIPDDTPDQERIAIGKNELAKLKRLIDALPSRCRKMFVMRKIEGLTQRQIAERLGVSENTVDTQVGRGLRLILGAWKNQISDKVDEQETSQQRRMPWRKPD